MLGIYGHISNLKKPHYFMIYTKIVQLDFENLSGL